MSGREDEAQLWQTETKRGFRRKSPTWQRFCDHALLRPRAQQSPAVGHWHCWAQGLSQEAAQIKGKMWGKTSLQSSLCYMAGMGLSAVARSRKQW